MILLDAGPLLALNDSTDSAHDACREKLARLPDEEFATTWPCVAEARYFLGLTGGYVKQQGLWQLWHNGIVQFVDLTFEETHFVSDLMRKYQEFPMDLADATLVALADLRGWKRIFTIDSHFFAYRLRDRSNLEVIVPEGLNP